MRQKLRKKVVLFGWAASAMPADRVATSIHPTCPGTVIHGAIADAILSGELWRHLPRWVSSIVTLFCGIVVSVGVAALSPWRAFGVFMATLAILIYSVSAILFDRYDAVMEMAGPLTASCLCWVACTLVVTIRERFDRVAVTRRFRTYVDPALVEYVLEHPDRATLTGESREMTVVFVDVAGFTTMTERLGEKSVAILNRLMNAIVPVIRRNRGFVNKFLGDGVMFFYGAPQPDPAHACNAIRTLLQIRTELVRFNAELARDELPQLGLRAGISTGPMIVGDAGAADASDYTVLGDSVNLGARLEAANKALGTFCLATARTAQLCGDDFLFAQCGHLQVVGKEEAVLVYEPLCRAADATVQDRELVQTLAEFWRSLSAGETTNAAAQLVLLKATFQRDKLAALLHELLEQQMRCPTASSKIPVIRLSSK